MSRFRFQCHNAISGFCIQRIPLCNLLSCTRVVKLLCVSQKISPVALLHDWKRKIIFWPEDAVKNMLPHDLLPQRACRDKAHSGRSRLLVQASCLGHGGW